MNTPITELRAEAAATLGASLPIAEDVVTIKFIKYNVVHIKMIHGTARYLIRKMGGKTIYGVYYRPEQKINDGWSKITGF